MNKQKRIWFAIVLPRPLIGYSLDVYPEEVLAYRNWCRRRGQLLANSPHEKQQWKKSRRGSLSINDCIAHNCDALAGMADVARDKDALSELKRINSTLTAIASEFPIRSPWLHSPMRIALHANDSAARASCD
jgi:hypothetical protein